MIVISVGLWSDYVKRRRTMRPSLEWRLKFKRCGIFGLYCHGVEHVARLELSRTVLLSRVAVHAWLTACAAARLPQSMQWQLSSACWLRSKTLPKANHNFLADSGQLSRSLSLCLTLSLSVSHLCTRRSSFSLALACSFYQLQLYFYIQFFVNRSAISATLLSCNWI